MFVAMHPNHLQSLVGKNQPRNGEGKLKAVETISRFRVSAHISREELEREIDRARAQEIGRGLTGLTSS
jgi:hypothetical protein